MAGYITIKSNWDQYLPNESNRLYATAHSAVSTELSFKLIPNWTKLTLACFPKKGTIFDMNNISIADILELPVQERIRLVELIWDSIAAVPEAVEVSPALKAELEARLVEFEANPEAGYSWDQVKSRLKDGSWRTA